MGDWVEFVICGTRTCADGTEDYDANGVSDAAELAACVKSVNDLAVTGGAVALWVAVAAALALAVGVALRTRRRRAGTGTSA
ncbi:hypothetical protein ASE56_15905 [Microbacterium sp. Leaf203]|nr:hypothetical protein ASE56_15905 [Microbacterium sp. Leaf203]